MVILALREVRSMPTYEYRCQACSHEMEAFQSIKDAPLKECPACHAEKLERLISATSFQLKGGGWYKDLYSSSKPTSSSSDKSDKAA
jgi:putative FmdB family regulatory protein